MTIRSNRDVRVDLVATCFGFLPTVLAAHSGTQRFEFSSQFSQVRTLPTKSGSDRYRICAGWVSSLVGRRLGNLCSPCSLGDYVQVQTSERKEKWSLELDHIEYSREPRQMIEAYKAWRVAESLWSK